MKLIVDKMCNLDDLLKELRDNGHAVEGAIQKNNVLELFGTGLDKASVRAIVESHIPKPVPVPEQIDWKKEYNNATAISDKLDVVARKLGLK